MIGMILFGKENYISDTQIKGKINNEDKKGINYGRKQIRYTYIKRSSRIYESEYGYNIQTCPDRENPGIQSWKQVALQKDIY